MKTKFVGVPIICRKNLIVAVMRTFIFLFCVMTFGFTTKSGFSQNKKIVIDTDQELTVEQVFDLIRQQTDYSFIYRSDLFKDAPKIKVIKGETNVNDLLKKSLSFDSFNYQLSPDGSLLVNKLPTAIPRIEEVALQQIITGAVTDMDGVALPGATVTLKEDSTVGVQTDFDGNYSIEATSESTLVFRYLGFLTKEVLVGSQTTINVSLEEDAQGLDEVVIVGFGVQRKAEVTAAISSVDVEKIQKIPTADVATSLQGQVAGLNRCYCHRCSR